MHELRQFPINAEMQECIRICTECHEICTKAAIYCQQSESHAYQTRHIRMLYDCAEICQTNANFLLRGSDMHTYTCAVCSEVCDVCAQACSRMEDDAQMQACSEICRRCANSCHHMAGIPV